MTIENRTNGFNELVKQIKQLLAKKSRIVVAITGFGGAGKSNLADRLRDFFNLRDAQLIRIDNLYSTNPNGPGMLDQVDWVLLESILAKVRAGNKMHYQGRDHQGNVVTVNEDLPNVVIIEGIRLLQPKFMPSFDVSVWIDCPQDFAKQRAKARDRSQGDDEETVNRWDTDWGPKDKAYFDMYRPDKLASFIYDEFNSV